MESWITAERAGSLWPLVVADFYLEHTIIQEPGEFEPMDEEQDGSQKASPEDEDDVDELILDLLKNGENLLRAGFKVFYKAAQTGLETGETCNLYIPGYRHFLYLRFGPPLSRRRRGRGQRWRFRVSLGSFRPVECWII